MDHEYYMGLALELAEEAGRDGDVPVGCVLVKDGVIVGEGRNRREERGDATAHAELEAIRDAGARLGSWRLHGVTMYVTLEPCPMCAGAISQARISRLIYAAADTAYGCAGSVYRIPEDPAFNHFCKCDGGVLEADCRALLEDFFRGLREKDGEI